MSGDEKNSISLSSVLSLVFNNNNNNNNATTGNLIFFAHIIYIHGRYLPHKYKSHKRLRIYDAYEEHISPRQAVKN